MLGQGIGNGDSGIPMKGGGVNEAVQLKHVRVP